MNQDNIFQAVRLFGFFMLAKDLVSHNYYVALHRLRVHQVGSVDYSFQNERKFKIYYPR